MRLGFLALFAGLVILIALLDLGAGPEIITWPMLLAGLGVGALASQLGAVTVSAVPDEQSGEVGGLQNTVTNLGASIGTALAGAVLISALTASFFAGIQDNPGIPEEVDVKRPGRTVRRHSLHLRRRPEQALEDAGVPAAEADAIVEENAEARLDGLRSSLAVLAVFAILAFVFANGIPTRQPGAAPPTDVDGVSSEQPDTA